MKKIITAVLIGVALICTNHIHAQTQTQDSLDTIPTQHSFVLIEGIKHGLHMTRTKRGDHGQWNPVKYNVVQFENVHPREKIWVEDVFGKKYLYNLQKHTLEEII